MPGRKKRAKRRTPVVQMTLPRELIRAIDQWAAHETARRRGAVVTRSQAVRELVSTALDLEGRSAPAVRGPIRVLRLGEEPLIDPDALALGPAERIEMMGELALTAYAMRGDDVAGGVRRDVVRVVRGGR